MIKANETGYVNRISVTQGDTLKFFISTKRDPFTLTIYKYEHSDQFVQTFSNITGGERASSDSCYYYGCNWPLSFSVKIPDTWLPGVYYASFPTSVGTKSVTFFVKSRKPGSFSKILYLTSANTWEAYNPFGGKSLYDFNSSDSTRSYKVSFLRPGRAYGGFPEFYYELPLMKWLFNNNINVEYAVNYDLYTNPDLLKNYNIFIIGGHSEYWAYPERIQVQNFERDGGNVIILSGNTLWWQVRYENDGNTLVCYKDKTLDPLTGVRDSFVTVNWRVPPVNDPENKMTGLSFIAGGYVNKGSIFPRSDGWGGYTVVNHHNWVYNGTNLNDGDEFGYPDSIVGNESDGALFTWQNGIPVLTGNDGSPVNYRVLGITPAFSDWGFTKNPFAMMGIFHIPGGGNVFNAATIFWANGFENNFYVQKITRNVLDKFMRNRFPPDIVGWTPFNVDTLLIHHKNEPVNNRNFLIGDPHDINFCVNVEDPFNKPVNFRWFANGLLSPGTDSVFSFNTSGFPIKNKVNNVTAITYNDMDTSAISWNFFSTQLAFYSTPVTDVRANSLYFYKINVFNYYNDSLIYNLQGPSWLTINKSGELSGTPATSGKFNIKVSVSNQHNQTDIQSFSISVDPLSSVNHINLIASNYSLKQNYPNPFNPSTNIAYSLPLESNVKIIIYNSLGETVKTLLSGVQIAGNHDIVFDASALSSGIYFYTLVANSFDGKNYFKQTKKLVLLK